MQPQLAAPGFGLQGSNSRGIQFSNPNPQVGASNNLQVTTAPMMGQNLTSTAPKGTTPTGSVLGAQTTAPNNAAQNTSAPDYSAFKSLYDAQTGNIQHSIDALPAYQNAAAANVQMQYTPQFNTLLHQNAQGGANLDLAQNQLDTQRTQGLRNLGNTLRGSMNGYQNQIGVMGAGNSSAAPMISYALSQQGNRQAGDMNTGYDQQQTGLNQQKSNLGVNYHDQLDNLNGWKQAQINGIAQQYAQQQDQMQQQLMSTQGEEANYLARYGQSALANQTIQQMQALAAEHSNKVQQLNDHFAQVNAPNADISQYAGPYNIQQVAPSQLAPLSFGANQDTTPSQNTYASLTRRPDQAPASSNNYGF